MRNVILLALLAACSGPQDTDKDDNVTEADTEGDSGSGGTDSETEAGTDSGSDTDGSDTETGSDSDPGSDTDPGSDSGSDPSSDSGSDPASGSELGSDTDPATDSGSDPATDSDPGSDPDTDPDTGTSDPGSEPDSDSDPDTDPDTGTSDPGSEPDSEGSDPDTDSGSEPDSDTGSDTGSEPDSDSDTGSDTGSEPDSDSDSDSGSEGDTDSDSETEPVVQLFGHAPAIRLVGGGTVYLPIGGAWTDPGVVATDDEDGDLSGAVTVTGLVTTAAPGVSALTYAVTDSDGHSASQTRYVDVVPGGTGTKIPLGPDDVVLAKGTGDATRLVDEQTLAGDPVGGTGGAPTTAWSSTNGATTLPHQAWIDLGGPWVVTQVSIRDTNGSGELAFSAGGPGAFRLLFVDPLDNYLAWATTSVFAPGGWLEVEKRSQAGFSEIVAYGYPFTDLTPPTMSLLGPTPLYIETGSFYLELGVEALDSVDGDLADDVLISGVVNPNVPGTYVVSYSATDLSGNSASVTREVIVGEDQPPDLVESELTIEQRKTLERDRTLYGALQPATGHPRLRGDDDQWREDLGPLDDLPCVGGAVNGHGYVVDIKDRWEVITRGGASCTGGVPTAISDHPAAAYYLKGTGSWSRDNAYQVIHLLRRERACHNEGGACWFTEADVEALTEAFVTSELARLPSEDWHSGYDGTFFDLGALPAFRTWCLFLDVFWDDPIVPDADRAAIEAKLSFEIDSFLNSYETGHWSLYNGNNWTPVLADAAVWWGLTFYYEDPRAQDVIAAALDVMWLHRDGYLEDGSYDEGVVEYTNVSFEPMIELDQLLRASFASGLDSPRWDRVRHIDDWYLDNTCPDGLMVDFGDSWAKKGYSVMTPVHAMLIDELRGAEPLGSVDLDACRLRRFFENKYFDHGLRNPWQVYPVLARDWSVEVAGCTTGLEPEIVRLFPDGGTGSIRTVHPGETTLGSDASSARYAQSDQTFVAVSAIPNGFSHREMDFGALIWTAWGHRLLWDFGYGKIAGANVRYNASTNLDNVPMGTNTLYIPEAAVGTSDYSQIHGTAGTITEEDLDGYAVLHVQGDEVYGQLDAKGWLDHFDRWVVSIGEGQFLVVDAFDVRADRGTATPREQFYTRYESDPTCGSSRQHVAVSLKDDNIELKPACNMLTTGKPVESLGVIAAAGLHPGHFEVEATPVTLMDQTNNLVSRSRFSWRPDQAVATDVRAFVLAAGTTAVPAASVTEVPCDGACFAIDVGGESFDLVVSDESGRWDLVSLSP